MASQARAWDAFREDEMIQTVSGRIKPSELGVTMCHEHFIVDLTAVRKDGVSKIETAEEVKPEIQLMMSLGVQAAVEVTTIDLKRDIRKLKQISDETGLKIVASTGFYLDPFHPDWLRETSAEEIADIFIKELTEGIEETGIRAGIIAEIASSPEAFTPSEMNVLKAAGIAAVMTGSAVSTHTGRKTAQETIDTLIHAGVNPDKIIIGHQDLIDDSDYHLALLKQGVNIAFDTCGKSAYMSDDARAENAIKIIRSGYGDHLMLSNDVSRNSYFVSNHGTGYTAAMSIVVPKILEKGGLQKDIDKLLIDNPARILNNRAWD